MDAPTPTSMDIGTSTPTPALAPASASTPAPAPASSVAASCYPSPPIDSSIGIEESIDVESDTQGIRCAGRPPWWTTTTP
jgi:hypothetical protein